VHGGAGERLCRNRCRWNCAGQVVQGEEKLKAANAAPPQVRATKVKKAKAKVAAAKKNVRSAQSGLSAAQAAATNAC
jgi:hypothetical protein